jgi:glycosyltransferase involved in cell wall biosynthesis
MSGVSSQSSSGARIVHVFDTPGTNESRFLKEAQSTLASGVAGSVVLLCRWEPGLPDEETPSPGLRIRRLRRSLAPLPRNKIIGFLKRIESLRLYERALRLESPDMIHCHSLFPLSVCVRARRALGVPLIYDAHELETECCGIDPINRAVHRHLERRNVRGADAILCVSDSIADWYRDAYGIARPAVVRNIPDLRRQTGQPDPAILRERFGIPPEDLVFIYQGGLFRGRRIEQFIRIFERTRPDRHLVFMGYGELEPLAREAAARRPNIHHLPAVPPGDVLRHTAGADVGLTGVENVCLSYFFSLPNKLFEYLVAGIPFLVPDFPEMRRIVEAHGCGWIVDDADDAWVARIDRLTAADVQRGKDAARKTAPSYSWQNEERTLLDVCRRLLSSPTSGSRA